ncbi:Proteasome subunit beta type-4 [Camellia lanceoleosa]|uniref:Proteasome subunit beta type-4 n=1 Tax=Camellia lanceoleosa TaxID=1840588 RepID=A0ACC0IZV6_9ERIC|nr:Proteasome subunit beta type-4 [Camellia lanceoleosa]
METSDLIPIKIRAYAYKSDEAESAIEALNCSGRLLGTQPIRSNQKKDSTKSVSWTALKVFIYPYVTGTSVIGIKFKDGILMAADMGGSYGSTLRYKSVERLKSVGKHSPCLYDNMWDDGNLVGPKEVHNYLTRMMYNRRNKFNPLWNSLVLGGVKNGQKYLGTVILSVS